MLESNLIRCRRVHLSLNIVVHLEALLLRYICLCKWTLGRMSTEYVIPECTGETRRGAM